MTALLERTEELPLVAPLSVKERQSWQFRRHIRDHLISYLLLAILLVLAAVTTVWNLAGYPRWFSDEGVYVSQAWAVQVEGQLANYTYWYDHPPLGWIQIALWSIVTGGLRRYGQDTIMAGREFMVVMHLTAVALLYVLARRLRFRRSFAFAAGLLYTLSPLVVSFSRYVFLDNVAVVWVLAAMALALSPTRKLVALVGSALCLSVAVLSKETVALVLPAVLYLVWRNYRRSPNRGYGLWLFTSVALLVGLMYPLYAVLKGELIPGPGHVSLIDALKWQLSGRTGSGSLLDPHSDARQLVDNVWLGLDKWLPLAGAAAVLPGLCLRKLRAPAIAMGVQLATLFKGGYLPYPYIIALLPFAALLVAGTADAFWPSLAMFRQVWCKRALAGLGVLLVAAMATPFARQGIADWRYTLAYEFTTDQTISQHQVVDWADRHLPKDTRLVTEGELWLDLHNRGFTNPMVVWVYKVDTDSAVKQQIGGLPGIDYLVVNKSTLTSGGGTDYPTVVKAAQGAQVMADFGSGPDEVLVLKVNHTT